MLATLSGYVDATPVFCSSSRRRVFNGLPVQQVEMVGALGGFGFEPVKRRS